MSYVSPTTRPLNVYTRKTARFHCLCGPILSPKFHIPNLCTKKPTLSPSTHSAGMQHDPQLQSKDWIRDKIQNLRSKSGIPFNQDLFISILLCLISGPGRHLILTASEDQLPNVINMANKVQTAKLCVSHIGQQFI